MRKLFISGNWKMNKNFNEGNNLMRDIDQYAEKKDKIDIAIFPPNLYLKYFHENYKNITVGSQNLYFKNSGAYTGEISPSMLKSIGINWTIIGHSERRTIFGETPDIIKKKIDFSLENDFNPVVCIGENIDQREKSMELDVIKMQVKNIYYKLQRKDAQNIILAYEPLWAIGTGKTASPEDADKIHGQIRKEIKKIYDEEFSSQLRILYGGSVKPHNAQELLSKKNIDGALIGGASLKSDSFLKICDIAGKIMG
ncbi:MAG TPA: triose-phosphate isomerase [Candidatus Mcinerneyibacterium sp.]|nr:triose-phosphate isomerase [Candidatus Mcinerneyibacterium sp.]